jgi:hypothetical protein
VFHGLFLDALDADLAGRIRHREKVASRNRVGRREMMACFQWRELRQPAKAQAVRCRGNPVRSRLYQMTMLLSGQNALFSGLSFRGRLPSRAGVFRVLYSRAV